MLLVETVNGETLVSTLVDLPPLGTSESFYADGNGSTKRQVLDNAGQQVTAQDGVGLLPNTVRNERNQVNQQTSSRGNVTQYTYDEAGNVLSVIDSVNTDLADRASSAAGESIGLFTGQVYEYHASNSNIYDVSLLETGDLNQDGIADVIASTDGGIAVLLGNGVGYEPIELHRSIDGNYNDVEFGDFNNDGNVDIALLEGGGSGYGSGDDHIAILEGDGAGGLSLAHEIDAVGVGYDFNGADQLLVMDVDLDGVADDLLVSSSDGVDVFIGGGDSTSFTHAGTFHSGGSRRLFQTDYDGDALPDLVSVGHESILSLELTGNAATPLTETVIVDGLDRVSGPSVVEDLNGDGVVDVAYTNGYSLHTLLSTPEGTYTASQLDTLVDELVSVGVGTSDRTNLVSRNRRNGVITVYAEDGNGSYAPVADYTLNTNRDISESLLVGDWTGDGLTDLVSLTQDGREGSISVLAGTSDGQFRSLNTYRTTSVPQFGTAVDVNQDGNLDIVTVDWSGVFSVLYGNGNGTFNGDVRVSDIVTSFDDESPYFVDLAALNQGQQLDLVSLHTNNTDISVLFGVGEGQFDFRQDYTLAGWISRAGAQVVDVDGDDVADIVVAERRADGTWQLRVLQGNGDGSFSQDDALTTAIGFNSPTAWSVSDLNGDGDLDIVMASYDRVLTFFGDGDGTFSSGGDYLIDEENSNNVEDIALSDVDGDGDDDLVVLLEDYRGVVGIWLNDGSGNLSELGEYRVARDPHTLTVGLIDGDDIPDIAVAGYNNGYPAISVRLGNGDGTFGSSTTYRSHDWDGTLLNVSLADINGDGLTDIVANMGSGSGSASADSLESMFDILLGDGSGSFNVSNRIRVVTPYLADLALADMDGDGDVDVVGINPRENVAYTYLNRANDSPAVVGGLGTRYTYDETFNEVTSITDALGRQTLYEIDAVTGQRLSMTQVVGALDSAENGETDDVVTRYSYIARGAAAASQMDTQTDALGRVTDYDYDALGRLQQVTYAKGTVDEAVERYEYDGAGNRTAVIDAAGNRTEYTYDAGTNRVKTITSAVGTAIEATQSFEYDAMGRQTAVVDAKGNRTEYRYDAMGRQTHVIGADPDGVDGPLASPVSQSVYDKAGNLIESIDPLGRVTRYVYDARNRLIETILPDESVLTTGYDADNNRAASTGVDGQSTRSFYDLRGRLTRTIDELGHETTFEYDAANQMIAQTDANEVRTEYEYDDLGRRVAVTTAAGTAEAITTRTEYDKVGNVVAQIDGLGQRTVYSYDHRNRRTAIIDAAAEPGTTRFRYDVVGNLLSITDSEENTTSYGYDARNRLTLETNALGQTRTFSYDGNGNRTKVTDRNGRETVYAYDGLNRQTTEQWLDGNGQAVNAIITTYDAANQVTSLRDAHSAYTFTYDALGYQDRVDNIGFGGMPQVVLDYAYDAEGKLESVTDIIDGVPGATTGYGYDSRAQITSITQSGNGISAKRVEFDYSSIGQFEGIRRYSDIAGTQLVTTTDYRYDGHNRLERLSHSNRDGVTTSFYDFGYDEAHRISQIIDVDGTAAYGYDQTNQLISAAHSDADNPDETYAYDKNGNRTHSSQHGDDYVTGTNNQLETDGVYNYAYDDQGNMIRQEAISTGKIRSFEWDYRNRLVAVIDETAGVETQRVEYVYDVMGRRIAKTVDADGAGSEEAITTHFVYDGHNVLMEFVDDSSTPSQRYLHGPQIDQVLAQDDGTGQTLWLLSDHLGTVKDLVDETGTVLNHRTYDSYGNLTGQSDAAFSSRYGFTGRELDEETGLSYYRARYYNSELGQFISQDPIGFESNDTNLYRYVNNAPTQFTDPSGEKVYVGYRPFSSLNNSFFDNIGDRVAPAWHTAIILEPDEPCQFIDHTLFKRFKGGLAVLSGWPQTIEGDPPSFSFGRLSFVANSEVDMPWNMYGTVEVQTPDSTSDTAFIKQLIHAAEAHQDGPPVPYFPVPARFTGTYNSNSFVSGVIEAAGGMPPRIPLQSPINSPGYNRPVPIYSREADAAAARARWEEFSNNRGRYHLPF